MSLAVIEILEILDGSGIEGLNRCKKSISRPPCFRIPSSDEI